MTETVALTPKAFLFDANRCTGCQACELACSIENELDGFSWREVTTLNPAHEPHVPTIHLSMACNHCEEPPCMAACPALAYSKDLLTGRVDLDADLCVGCGYCSWACPYDAPKFDDGVGVMTKCTFCGDRQAAGLEPACVEQCPTGALGFGDLSELPGVIDAPGLPTLTPGPSIRFTPWRGSSTATACPSNSALGGGASPGGAAVVASMAVVANTAVIANTAPRKISLRSEWPLVGFTLIAAVLVATLAASVLGSIELSPLAFLGLAAVGMGLSTAHLGKPLRAWRAVLNVRHSWLSREIALFSAFMGLVTVHFLFPDVPWLAYAAGLVGVAALFAIDRVYDLVRPAESRFTYGADTHSADVVWTGTLLGALLLGLLWLAVALGLLKIGLYLHRKLERRTVGKDPRWGWSLGRLGAGFIAPLGLAWVDPGAWTIWALAGTAVGEIIDRCEFYEELEVPTPRGQMGKELAARRVRPAARGGATP